MKDEHTLKEDNVPKEGHWSQAACTAWEMKVDEEIREYLNKPSLYHGPDLNY